MSHPGVIAKMLGAIRHRVERVQALRKASADELSSDEDALDLVAFNLMLAVQAACDVAAHVIAEEGFAPASTLAEGFSRLAEKGVISSASAKQLGRAVGLRNVVAHAYHKLDAASVHAASHGGLADLERFTAEVGAWLAGRGSGP